jgi:hypothetical protein
VLELLDAERIHLDKYIPIELSVQGLIPFFRQSCFIETLDGALGDV